VCDMESAGIFLVAKLNKVPCLFLKGISDTFNEGAKEYNLLKEETSLKCAKIIKIIINKI